jgi:hypothetical protein
VVRPRAKTSATGTLGLALSGPAKTRRKARLALREQWRIGSVGGITLHNLLGAAHTIGASGSGRRPWRRAPGMEPWRGTGVGAGWVARTVFWIKLAWEGRGFKFCRRFAS